MGIIIEDIFSHDCLKDKIVKYELDMVELFCALLNLFKEYQ